MLYVKLTLRNLQRSMKEYAIFMLTMVISMMLMYSFMAVAFSEQVLQPVSYTHLTLPTTERV